MNKSKRVVAFTLAALVLMGTLGYVLSIIASAVEISNVNGITSAEYQVKDASSSSPVQEIEKLDDVSFEITLSGTDTAFLGKDLTVQLSGGNFSQPTGDSYRPTYEAASKKVVFPKLQYYNNNGN